MTIYLPSGGPNEWQSLLADPVRHWRTGYSARTLAHCWEAAVGLPTEIDALLGGNAELLFAVPEHKVPLPGRGRASQCDVFALVRRDDTTISVAVEGKVDEPFGPLVGEWLAPDSAGRVRRLQAICAMLGRPYPPPPALHYQLFHRTAAAIVESGRFKTDEAAMLVHSFSPTGQWFGAFSAFAAYLGASVEIGVAGAITLPGDKRLTIGWAKGDPRFLEV